MVALRSALQTSPRDALLELATRLADEIDGCESARDRLPLVRAFLAAVAQLEALDAAARRAAARSAVDAPAQLEPLDELLARRRRRAN